MDCHEKHYAEFNDKPQYTAKVPGVVTLFGFYAKYYNGVSVTAADGRDVYVCASKSDKNQIVAFNSETGDKKRIALSSFKYRREDRWANFIKGAFHAVQQAYKIDARAMNITLCGENLDSEDSISGPMIALGVLLIVNEMEGLKISDDKLVKAVCNACSFCGCNVDTGRVTALVLALSGSFLCYDYSSGRSQFVKSPFESGDYKLLCIDSHIPPYTMKDEIMRMRETVEEVISVYGEHYPRRSVCTLSDYELNDRSIDLDEDSKRIAQFLKEDSTLAQQAAKALQTGELAQFGRYLSKFGRIVRDEVYFTCPELDWLAKRASEQSSQSAASNIYAGTGSMLCVFTEASNVDSVKARLGDYNHIFGFNLTAEVFSPAGRAALV